MPNRSRPPPAIRPPSSKGRLSLPPESARERNTLETRRFLFVTGKGGVGKTTLCGALALAFASRGKRVLVAMCNTKERLSAILGSHPIGDEIVQVAGGVWAVNMKPETALLEYGHLVFKVRAMTQAVFENKYVKAFFRAVPGLYEWAMLGSAWYRTTEKLPDGSNRFDVVLLDAPATGHGLDMLRVPKVILDVVPKGILRRDAEAAWELFHDSKKSGVILVTLPEEMPVTETRELATALQTELGLPVLQILVNGVLPSLFSATERAQLVRDPALLEIDAPLRAQGTGDAAIVAGARRSVREAVQAEALERLGKEIDLPKIFLPFLFDEAGSIEGTRILASKL